MSANNKQLVEYFHSNFYELSSNEEKTEKFIRDVINFAKEIHLQGNNKEISQLPLLAIVSELHEKYPRITYNIAKQEPILHEALKMVENYSDEKKLILRKNFL